MFIFSSDEHYYEAVHLQSSEFIYFLFLTLMRGTVICSHNTGILSLGLFEIECALIFFPADVAEIFMISLNITYW